VKPIEQTIMSSESGGGNCVAACIASVFEVPLKTVTVPLGGSYAAVVDWTAINYPGLYPINVEWDKKDWRPLKDVEPPTPFATYWIASVESPRTDGMHCIVMYGRNAVWDPHPRRDMGFGDCGGMGYWIVKDPSKLARTETRNERA
jgi:hypothetical protein